MRVTEHRMCIFTVHTKQSTFISKFSLVYMNMRYVKNARLCVWAENTKHKSSLVARQWQIDSFYPILYSSELYTDTMKYVRLNGETEHALAHEHIQCLHVLFFFFTSTHSLRLASFYINVVFFCCPHLHVPFFR